MSGAEIIFHKNRHSSYWSVQNILRAYQKLLISNPIVTKSVSSGVIACLGSTLSQAFSAGEISLKVSRSFLIFGTLITGPVTHYLYTSLDKLFPGSGLAKSFLRVLTDRLVFAPCFLFLTLYVLSRLQGEDHQSALDSTRGKYWVSLIANWKIWTLPQIININLVPLQYRVLFANTVALVWNFYLTAAKKK